MQVISVLVTLLAIAACFPEARSMRVLFPKRHHHHRPHGHPGLKRLSKSEDGVHVSRDTTAVSGHNTEAASDIFMINRYISEPEEKEELRLSILDTSTSTTSAGPNPGGNSEILAVSSGSDPGGDTNILAVVSGPNPVGNAEILSDESRLNPEGNLSGPNPGENSNILGASSGPNPGGNANVLDASSGPNPGGNANILVASSGPNPGGNADVLAVSSGPNPGGNDNILAASSGPNPGGNAEVLSSRSETNLVGDSAILAISSGPSRGSNENALSTSSDPKLEGKAQSLRVSSRNLIENSMAEVHSGKQDLDTNKFNDQLPTAAEDLLSNPTQPSGSCDLGLSMIELQMFSFNMLPQGPTTPSGPSPGTNSISTQTDLQNFSEDSSEKGTQLQNLRAGTTASSAGKDSLQGGENDDGHIQCSQGDVVHLCQSGFLMPDMLQHDILSQGSSTIEEMFQKSTRMGTAVVHETFLSNQNHAS